MISSPIATCSSCRSECFDRLQRKDVKFSTASDCASCKSLEGFKKLGRIAFAKPCSKSTPSPTISTLKKLSFSIMVTGNSAIKSRSLSLFRLSFFFSSTKLPSSSTLSGPKGTLSTTTDVETSIFSTASSSTAESIG